MADLFSELRIGTMTVPNRFARSATHDWTAHEDGTVSQREVEIYTKLGAGGVGLVIMGHEYVRRDGKCSAGMIGIDSDDKIPGLRTLAEAVHASGGAKIVSQINFGGAQVPKELASGDILAPSAREDAPDARAMTDNEAEGLIQAYVDAAVRSKEAGLDGVQLHGAHGYLLNQFLSPLANRRDDAFGGSFDGRALFLRRVVTGIRATLGREFPLLIKIASSDGLEGGLTLDESVKAAATAEELGLDAVEVSGGMRGAMNTRRPRTIRQEGFFAEAAAAFKEALSIPVISVGGYRSMSKMQEIVESGRADMVSLSRPFIREPDLVDKFRRGTSDKAACISCNGCLKHRDEFKCWAE